MDFGNISRMITLIIITISGIHYNYDFIGLCTLLNTSVVKNLFQIIFFNQLQHVLLTKWSVITVN